MDREDLPKELDLLYGLGIKKHKISNFEISCFLEAAIFSSSTFDFGFTKFLLTL